jgi:dCTP deaminase
MILCEREIQALLDDGLMLIDPRPPAESPQWSSTSVDLTLHNVLVKWEPKVPPGGGPVPPIVPMSENFNVQGMMEDPQYARTIPIDPDHGYLLAPKEFVLGFTCEKVRFPTRCRIAARVEGKSSLARLGLGVHVTAPTIHAGFGAKGENDPGTTIQLEIFNLGPWTIRLDGGMRICQLVLEAVREVPTTGYRGQFSDQRAFTVPGSGPDDQAGRVAQSTAKKGKGSKGK